MDRVEARRMIRHLQYYLDLTVQKLEQADQRILRAHAKCRCGVFRGTPSAAPDIPTAASAREHQVGALDEGSGGSGNHTRTDLSHRNVRLFPPPNNPQNPERHASDIYGGGHSPQQGSSSSLHGGYRSANASQAGSSTNVSQASAHGQSLQPPKFNTLADHGSSVSVITSPATFLHQVKRNLATVRSFLTLSSSTLKKK